MGTNKLSTARLPPHRVGPVHGLVRAVVESRSPHTYSRLLLPYSPSFLGIRCLLWQPGIPTGCPLGQPVSSFVRSPLGCKFTHSLWHQDQPPLVPRASSEHFGECLSNRFYRPLCSYCTPEQWFPLSGSQGLGPVRSPGYGYILAPRAPRGVCCRNKSQDEPGRDLAQTKNANAPRRARDIIPSG